MNWISVKERLPEIAKVVIITLRHSKQDTYSAFRAHGGWYCFCADEDPKRYVPNGIKGVEITHWMPLPEPPKV